MNTIRSLVRPVITVMVMGALVTAFLWLVFKYSNAELTTKIVEAFLISASTITGVWFGSRKGQ